MRTRRSVLFALGAAAAFPLTIRPAEAETYTMRLNAPDPGTSVIGQAGLHFATAVNRRSNGQLKVEVYANWQLVSQAATADSLASGIIDFAMISSPWLVQLYPRYQVFDMPFLFKDLPSAFRVLDGPVGEDLFAELPAKGIVGLTWGSGGFKELETTTRTVVVPDDMKGIRIRIAPGAINTATYQALGAVPVALDGTETYMALSQRVVDAVDVNLDAFTTEKFYTVVKHIAMSNHVFSAQVLIGSKRKIEALPPPLQAIIREEGKAMKIYWRTTLMQRLAANVQILKSNGVSFSEVQYQAFRKSVDPVYTAFQGQVGLTLLDRINRTSVAGGR